MPTYDVEPMFLRQYRHLTRKEKAQFRAAVKAFVEDLKAKREPHGGLRVKPWEGHPGYWELTWEYHDGRAIFRYGEEVPGKPGPHIIWERIGGHDILN